MSRLLLLGHPVSHSLSPAFQNAAIRAANIAAEYTALDVPPAELEQTVQRLRSAGGGIGGNVTIPHKQRMVRYCDVLSLVAHQTNAVNTFWLDAGVMYGDNTDVAGFDRAARALLGRDPAEETVLVLGAGGAASAVLAAVEGWPRARALIWSRSQAAAAELAHRFPRSINAPRALADAMAEASLIVNATPVGMHSDDLPFDVAMLPAEAAVLDLVYRRGETHLVRRARNSGHRAADGRTMLLEQGALAFEKWFDVEPDKMVMRGALEAALSMV